MIWWVVGAVVLIAGLEDESEKLELQKKSDQEIDNLYANRFRFKPENRKKIEEWYSKNRHRR